MSVQVLLFDNDGGSLYIPKSLQGDPHGLSAASVVDRKTVISCGSEVLAGETASIIE